MRLEGTGRETEVTEVYDVTVCSGCQGRLAYPHIRLGHLNCPCSPSGRHRTFFCLDCGSWTYDPPHDLSQDNVVGGTDYFG